MKDNKKKNATNTAKNTYLLTGLIECGKCGGTLTGKTNTSGKGYKTRYYVCNNKYRTHTCDANNINADDIESNVASGLRDYLLNSDFEEIADNVIPAHTSRVRAAKKPGGKSWISFKRNCKTVLRPSVIV